MESTAVKVFNLISEGIFRFQGSYQAGVIKWILIVYTLMMLFSIIVLARRYSAIYDYFLWGNKTKKRLEREKQKGKKPRGVKVPETARELVEAKLNSVNPNDWKIAVIEADKALDEALKNSGAAGESMGDRLKNVVSQDVGGDLDSVWEAHKVRNNIVHDANYQLSSEMARKAVNSLMSAVQALSGGK
ncbi:MAG: hypothetical protein ABIC19_04010 [Patescibacteria group bacterium]|nr:hypothetical protein [Patescibacteria group bacterium]